MADLDMAQAQLDEKERELAAVQADYDKAMAEKQVSIVLTLFCLVDYSILSLLIGQIHFSFVLFHFYLIYSPAILDLPCPSIILWFRGSEVLSFRNLSDVNILGTLWVQLLLQFSMECFETLQMFSAWNEDVHVVWIQSF